MTRTTNFRSTCIYLLLVLAGIFPAGLASGCDHREPAATSRTKEWKPEDIHPKVFQMVDCWLSDTATPVVTEFNLDAIRANRNQFDYDAVKKESGWITFQDDREMLRFRIISSNQEGSVVEYQENGGGTLTTQRTIRFIFCPRSFDVDGQKITVTVLRIISIL